MSLKAAAAAWRKLAADEREAAELAKRNGDVRSYEVRAAMYDRTAEAIDIQERTGISVCSCCHKPLGEGMKHGGYFH